MHFEKAERVCLPNWHDSHSNKDKMGPFFAILGDFDDPIDYGAIQKKQPK